MKPNITLRLFAFAFVLALGNDLYAQAPVADFTFSFPQYAYKVQFVDISSNQPTSWLWSFGDGSGTIAQNPVKTYSNNGTYVVCLTATNSFGSDQTCKTVTTWDAPDSLNNGNIKGIVYVDRDSNCTYNTVTDVPSSNIPIKLWHNGALEQLTFMGINNSIYGFLIDTPGTYTLALDTSFTPYKFTCPATGVNTVNIASVDSTINGVDFAVECPGGFDLVAKSMQGAYVPGRAIQMRITGGDAANFFDYRCAAGVSGSVTLTYTGPVQFVSAVSGALNPTASGNTLTWNIANFGSVNFFTDFNIIMHTDTTAQIGQQVCFTLTVNPIAGDNNPANNVLTHCFVVTASVDPNDKTAYPAGNIDTAQKELTYTIRFQNTGTAEAQHIYITDTLDSDVDASTFQLLAYSHQPMVQLKENVVRFNFPNINLPDSNSNEPDSHGYVQYKVKLKPNLPIGTVINNTAYIYFDFNAPVITNTTTNTISLNTGIATLPTATASFTLYPNPASNSIIINIPENFIGSTATVSDVMGRVVFKSEIANSKSEINLAGVGRGVYFISVGNRAQKLIINH